MVNGFGAEFTNYQNNNLMYYSGDSLHYQSIWELAKLIRNKQVSPVEITQMTLDRIKRLDQELHSYAFVMEEQALNAAKKAETEIQQGQYRGMLHGVPIAVKDLCYTKGIPTKGGLKVLDDFIPEFDATVITKLINAGCIILGKLNLTEGAVGGYHRQFQVPKNPWGRQLWPGGSSSGSGVAVAAGLCFGALGTDTGGSIRFPAMACGITGLKPQYGRVSRHGILPLAETMDHVGPMTRTVVDSALMLQIISGQDINDPTTLKDSVPDLTGEINQSLAGLKIGYDPVYATQGVDENLVDAIEAALEQLGTQGVEIVEIKVPEMDQLRENWKTICTYEAAKAHAAHYPSRESEYGDFFRDFLEYGSNTSEKLYVEAMQARHEFNSQFSASISKVDAMVCPGGGVPFNFPQELLYQSMEKIRSHMNPFTYFQFTIPANFTGYPSLAVPCGISQDGLLFNMQFIGKRFGEPMICRLGHAYQQLTDWHLRHPPL